jgi:chaperonin cofactor prefoldin
MAEMNEAHFETIDRNKDINLQRNKLKFLEDRIATLEKSLSALNNRVAELQQAEYERDINAK